MQTLGVPFMIVLSKKIMYDCNFVNDGRSRNLFSLPSLHSLSRLNKTGYMNSVI